MNADFESGNRVKSLENSFLNIDCNLISLRLTHQTLSEASMLQQPVWGLGFVLAIAKHKGSCLILS